VRTSATPVVAAATAAAALNGGVLLISSHGTLFAHAPSRTGCPKSRKNLAKRLAVVPAKRRKLHGAGKQEGGGFHPRSTSSTRRFASGSISRVTLAREIFASRY